MEQDDLIMKNDLLSQISALKASIKVLELDSKKNAAGIKSTKVVLKETEDKLKQFEDEVINKRQREIREQQERRQKEIKDDFKFINEYLKHVSTLKVGERPDPELAERFVRMVRRPHVIRELKLRLLK
jgi:hypothetical protein